jgi:hypothetical protein
MLWKYSPISNGIFPPVRLTKRLRGQEEEDEGHKKTSTTEKTSSQSSDGGVLKKIALQSAVGGTQHPSEKVGKASEKVAKPSPPKEALDPGKEARLKVNGCVGYYPNVPAGIPHLLFPAFPQNLYFLLESAISCVSTEPAFPQNHISLPPHEWIGQCRM